MKSFLFLFLLLFLASCENHQSIVNNVDEREANEIVVYLASQGIDAMKVQAPTAAIGAESAELEFNIVVNKDQEVEAMAALTRVGLPRRKGTSLLTLFAKSGLMSSDREETIRYQAGLAEELRNTIRKIDGVIDANVQISFPDAEETALPGAPPPRATAAVYIKHQGILEDPNSHLEVKIKRLLSGSVPHLAYEDVAVISDRSRFTDIALAHNQEMVGPKTLRQNYVSVWGVVMTKTSLTRFRVLFFFFVVLLILMLGAIGWVIYRFYPQMKESLLQRKKEETETPPPPS